MSPDRRTVPLMAASLPVLVCGVLLARRIPDGGWHAAGLLLAGLGLFLFAAALRARAERRASARPVATGDRPADGRRASLPT